MRISDWSSDVCSSDLHDLADVRLVGEQHHDAVDAGRRTAVRRRAELEGVYHAAEIRVDLGLRITGNLERLVHDVGAMVADRARRQFDAVADDVILPREDVERVPGFQRLQLALRHAERIVAEINLARVLVGLEHREVDDRSEETTSELQSLMRISYAVFCL